MKILSMKMRLAQIDVVLLSEIRASKSHLGQHFARRFVLHAPFEMPERELMSIVIVVVGRGIEVKGNVELMVRNGIQLLHIGG